MWCSCRFVRCYVFRRPYCKDVVAVNLLINIFFLVRQGDPSHWLACAIYVACRNVTEHTVVDSETLIEGNLVSLTRLLRLCNIR